MVTTRPGWGSASNSEGWREEERREAKYAGWLIRHDATA